jgi:ketosteroid isomerase-like protein
VGIEENKAVVRRYFAEVVSQGDLAVADELFAADYATETVHAGLA